MIVVMIGCSTAVLQTSALRFAPKSFSMGESALVVHGYILLFYTSHSFRHTASEEAKFLQVSMNLSLFKSVNTSNFELIF